jgi:hypothetical protein
MVVCYMGARDGGERAVAAGGWLDAIYGAEAVSCVRGHWLHASGRVFLGATGGHARQLLCSLACVFGFSYQRENGCTQEHIIITIEQNIY